MVTLSSSSTTTLNPNAPMFVPRAYREVEDFSEEWWDLVHSSPWFRDYWLQECFHDDHYDDSHFDHHPFSDIYDPAIHHDLDFLLFDENDDVVANNSSYSSIPLEKGRMDLISLGLLKWRKPRGLVEMTKYGDKAPKIVNVRVSPRPIKQPR